jgi:multidrug efflux system membrane fusion protein
VGIAKNLGNFAGYPAPAWTGLLVVLTCLMVTACGHAPPPTPPAALVLALPVQHDTRTGGGDMIRYPVEVQARYSNTMSFRVPGKLIERTVRIGNTVKKGQLLARLDPLDAQKQVSSAQATLDGAEHRLVYARQQLERDKAQSEQNLIAANQWEQTQDAYSSALSARDQAAAQLVVARNNLQYNTLVAEHDGVITSENADTGQVVSAGQAIYGLAWSADTDVVLDASESDLGRMGIGQAATITFPGLPGQRFQAQVREISPAADPQTRTYRVKLTLREPGQTVRLGMTGDAELMPIMADGSTVANETFTVPATAIFHQSNSPAVWVVSGNNSTLELRPVKVRTYSDHSSTISSGLEDGDVVVLAGVHTVYAGQQVKTVRPLFDGEGDVAGPASDDAGDRRSAELHAQRPADGHRESGARPAQAGASP